MFRTAFILILLLLVNPQISYCQAIKLEIALHQAKLGDLEKAKTNIDELCNSINSKENIEAWIARGKIYHDIFDSPYKKDKFLDSCPLFEAQKSYLIAYKILSKSKKSQKKSEKQQEILNQLAQVKSHIKEDIGIVNFYENNFALALNAFERMLQIDSVIDKVDYADTIYYLAAQCAYKTDDYSKALFYYNICNELGFGGQLIWIKIAQSYKALKDTAMAIKILNEGCHKINKENHALVSYTIESYLELRDTAGAFKLINAMIKQNPKNEVNYVGKGKVLAFVYFQYQDKIDKMNNEIENLREGLTKMAKDVDDTENKTLKTSIRKNITENLTYVQALEKEREEVIKKTEELYRIALKTYKEALSRNPEYYEANNDLGRFCIEKAKILVRRANYILLKQKDRYLLEMEKVQDALKDAKAYLEKVNDLKPGQPDVLNMLLFVYKRCEYAEKEQLIRDALDQMKIRADY